MFILFGFGKRTIKDYEINDMIKCRRCNNTKPWEYKKVTTWFTLFFIPVIPYNTAYLRVCPICGEHDKLTKDEFMTLAEDGEGSVTVDVQSRYEGMTETQANYMREMDAIKEERQSDNG